MWNSSKIKVQLLQYLRQKKLTASFNSRELDFTDLKSGRSGKEEEEEDSEEVGS